MINEKDISNLIMGFIIGISFIELPESSGYLKIWWILLIIFGLITFIVINKEVKKKYEKRQTKKTV